MKTVEVIGGLYVQLPNREYNLLKKLLATGKKEFKRSKFTPRTDVLARSLIAHHILDKDDTYFYLRKVQTDI